MQQQRGEGGGLEARASMRGKEERKEGGRRKLSELLLEPEKSFLT